MKIKNIWKKLYSGIAAVVLLGIVISEAVGVQPDMVKVISGEMWNKIAGVPERYPGDPCKWSEPVPVGIDDRMLPDSSMKTGYNKALSDLVEKFGFV